jgi:hypothetical protein
LEAHVVTTQHGSFLATRRGGLTLLLLCLVQFLDVADSSIMNVALPPRPPRTSPLATTGFQRRN